MRIERIHARASGSMGTVALLDALQGTVRVRCLLVGGGEQNVITRNERAEDEVQVGADVVLGVPTWYVPLAGAGAAVDAPGGREDRMVVCAGWQM